MKKISKPELKYDKLLPRNQVSRMFTSKKNLVLKSLCCIFKVYFRETLLRIINGLRFMVKLKLFTNKKRF